MSGVARAKSPPSRLGALALVVIIFIGLGPLAGGLAVWIFISVPRVINMGIGHSDPVGYMQVLAFILFFGYVIGIGYALVAGIVVAVAGIWMRWNNLLTPFLAAAIATIVGTYVISLGVPEVMGDTKLPGMFAICLLAALVCWFLTRGIVRATWQDAA